MKAIASILMTVLAAACGGSDKGETTTPVTEEQPPAGEEMGGGEAAPPPTTPPEAEPPPPPPPKKFSATVAVAPVKGSKMKAATVSLEQEEGKPVAVSGSFEGLKPGKYVWVIHENGDCAKNATKVGKAFAATESATVAMEVTKEAPGSVAGDQAWTLDGEQSVVGKALVLHEMKKDKPGKALACGVISSGEAAAPPAEGGGGGGGGGGAPAGAESGGKIK